MKPSVYLETTIVSYLTARSTRDLIMTAKIQATQDWWEDCRDRYELFVSDPVLSESSDGDPDAARRRMEILATLPMLRKTEEADVLAERFFREIPLPPQSELDALHLAIRTVNGVDFLLTWNCRHLANASLRPRIESICHQAGYMPPIICTPLELTEPGL